ncbi:7829_t:CDS:2, partial [Scutellospora calospora]
KNDEFEKASEYFLSHFVQASEFFPQLKILLKDAHDIETNNEDDIEQERNLTNLITLNMVKPIIELLGNYIKTVNVQGSIFSKDTQNKPDYIQVPKK